jgi:hypothetical protein
MKWRRVFEKGGYAWSDEGIDPDPFHQLAHEADPENSASVSMTVGKAIEYAEVKCSANIRLNCPQSERHINMAGEVAFFKALELVDDGMSHILPGWERTPVET